jgi:hypothetical protein
MLVCTRLPSMHSPSTKLYGERRCPIIIVLDRGVLRGRGAFFARD